MDANPLYNYIRSCLHESLITFFKKYLNESTKDQDFESKVTLLSQILNDVVVTDQLTFGHLKTLHQNFPNDFKGLRVNAVETTDKPAKLKVFTTETEDSEILNVEIALACRASASVPYKFAPVVINGRTYVDGGVIDNYPYDGIAGATHENTLIFSLDDPAIEKRVFSEYDNDKSVYGFSSIATALLDSALPAGEASFTTAQEIRAADIITNRSLAFVNIHTPEINFLSFKEAHLQAGRLELQGYFDSKNFMMNHGIIPESLALRLCSFLLNHFEIFLINKGLTLEFNESEVLLLKVIKCFMNSEMLLDEALQSFTTYRKICDKLFKELSTAQHPSILLDKQIEECGKLSKILAFFFNTLKEEKEIDASNHSGNKKLSCNLTIF